MKKEKLEPMLIGCLKNYNKQQFFKDLIAGIIVAVIALPLSIALALASGVGPNEGIYTAIVAGFLISLFGGSRVQIAGPTAAFATIVAGIVATDGLDGLMMATIFAGIILLVMGFLRLGSLIRFIPYTITTGFTAGIAMTIIIGQLKDFLGLAYPAGTKTIETLDKLKAVIANSHTLNTQALIVGIICVIILVAWPLVPRIGEVVPGSLIAVFAGIFMVKGLHL
ncbi:MAG TPA: sodium-independent anion transporter, partial [Kandleria vitulina]|nr:sodium-independent anion transporter [Kandleria vitulina]